MEKITYIVTNYNNANYLDECLMSVLNQTDPNWECIVVDDCSTDESLKVLEKYKDTKILLLNNKENVGQIKSTILGMNAAKTDIVGLLDSDDSLNEDATLEVLKAYSKSNRIGMVTTNSIEYDANMNEIQILRAGNGVPVGKLSSMIFGYLSALKTFRVTAYKKTDGYDLSMLCGEDLDLIYKLEEVTKHYYVNKFLYKRRNLVTSKSKISENWLIGIDNHKIAKLRALKRRNVSGMLLILSKLYIYSEYNRLLAKHFGRKINKKIYKNISFLSKLMLSKLYYKLLVVNKR